MTIINGGLINCGGAASSSSSNTLALSDGLACFTGSFSGVTTTSISHNLNSSNLVVEFKDSLGNLLIPDTWSITNPNVIEADFSPAATGDVTIIACIESGLAPITGGVTTVEGLSGIVDFDSPNGSILITTSGQVVNFNAIFTPASGAVLEQKCRDITILSGLIGTGGGGGVASINNISGIVTLTSTNNGLEVGVNGQSIEFTPLFTYTSGQIIDQHTQDLLELSGLIGTGDAGQTSVNGLSGAIQVTSPDGSILIGDSPQTIELSGLFTAASGAELQQKYADIDTLSGLILPDGGQTSINGISGVTSLDSPSDTISIVVNGQVIELDGIFTWASGQLLESLANASGVQSLNSISGLIDLVASNNGITVTNNGQVIELSTLFTYASGQLVDQNTQDILTVSGLLGGGDSGQTSVNGLSGTLVLTSPDGSILIGDGPQAIQLSGLFTAASGAVLQQKCQDILTLSGIATQNSADITTLTGTINGVDTRLIDLSGLTDGLPRTQTSIEGVSGVVNLEGLDGTVVITVDGQTIQLSGLFNPSSGEILEQKCRDIDTLSGLILSDSGQTSIDGLSGVILLDSPDGTILIGQDGQTIELSGLFTQASGALLQQHSEDLLTLSGLIPGGAGGNGQTSINGLSGVTFLTSPDGSILIGDNGQAIEISGLFTAASGAVLQQHSQDLVDLSGLIFSDGGQTSVNGLSGTISISGVNLQVTTSGQTILVSGIMNAASGAIIEQKCRDIDTLSGLILADSGQTSVNGLSGALTVTSPDGSILVGDGPQTIELSGLFTDTSGALLQQKCADIDTLSGLVTNHMDSGQTAVNGLSGAISLASPNNSILIGDNGQTIELSGLFTSASGAVVNQNTLDVLTLSGLILADAGQTSVNGLSGAVQITSPDGSILVGDSPQAIELSGLFTTTSGAILQQKCVDIDILSGLVVNHMDSGQTSINGISGVTVIDSTNDSISVVVNGQVIELDAIFTWASGEIVEQHSTDLLTLSGLVLADTGQTAINGLSGMVQVTSPDGSILIGDSPQTIELSGLFTNTSGALVQQHSADLLSLSGLILADSGQTSIEGLSGVVDLDSPDGTVIIGVNGQAIELTVLPDAGQTSANGLSGALTLTSPDNSILIGDNSQSIELSGLFTPASGAVLQQKCEDIDTLSGLIPSSSVGKATMTFTETSGTFFVLEHSLNTLDFTFNMWRGNDDGSISYTLPSDVYPSGFNHAVVALEVSMSGKLVLVG